MPVDDETQPELRIGCERRDHSLCARVALDIVRPLHVSGRIICYCCVSSPSNFRSNAPARAATSRAGESSWRVWSLLILALVSFDARDLQGSRALPPWVASKEAIMITSQLCKAYLAECEAMGTVPEISLRRASAVMGICHALGALAVRLQRYDQVVQEENR